MNRSQKREQKAVKVVNTSHASQYLWAHHGLSGRLVAEQHVATASDQTVTTCEAWLVVILDRMTRLLPQDDVAHGGKSWTQRTYVNDTWPAWANPR